MDKAKYQWSMKLDNGEIFVIQSNNFNELKLDIEQMKIYIQGLKRREEIDSVPIEDELKPKFVDHTKRTWNGKTFEEFAFEKKCPECGADAFFNECISKKNGKPYKNLKCKKDEGHLTWAS